MHAIDEPTSKQAHLIVRRPDETGSYPVLKIALGEWCLAVHQRHKYAPETYRYEDNGIIWHSGICERCGTITYVPTAVEPKEKLVQIAA